MCPNNKCTIFQFSLTPIIQKHISCFFFGNKESLHTQPGPLHTRPIVTQPNSTTSKACRNLKLLKMGSSFASESTWHSIIVECHSNCWLHMSLMSSTVGVKKVQVTACSEQAEQTSFLDNGLQDHAFIQQTPFWARYLRIQLWEGHTGKSLGIYRLLLACCKLPRTF